MKKIIALLLALSMLFLCACSENGDADKETATENVETTVAAQTTTAPAETTDAPPEYVSEWGSDLLPAGFPPPPANTYDVTIFDIPAATEYSGACHDITRIIFSCPEKEFYTFCNSLSDNGFFGGMKNITNGTLYSDGFSGGWKCDEYIIIIVLTEYEENGDLKICLDLSENVSAFPEALNAYFPEFAFPARTGGKYYGYNSVDGEVTETFNGKFEHIYWQWQFRFDNAFTGVSMDDFNKYIDALEAAGFSGEMTSDTVDGCTVINGNIVKDDYAVILTYNQVLKRMDIIYTNHSELYIEAEE